MISPQRRKECREKQEQKAQRGKVKSKAKNFNQGNTGRSKKVRIGKKGNPPHFPFKKGEVRGDF